MQITPYLNFDGTCAEAFRWYARVLDGEAKIMTFGDSPMAEQTPPDLRDRTLHARLEAGGAVVLGSDSMPGRHEKPQGFWVSVQLDDVGRAERIFNALSEGGTTVMPLQQTFWAPRFGMLVDRYGTPWMVNCEEGGA